MQALLGKGFNVTGLAKPGTTMQKAGKDIWGPDLQVDASWWNTSEFKQLACGKWDVVLLALGTNDAKDEFLGGAPNWKHELCDGKLNASCPFVKDYASMIELVRGLGRSEDSPDIY